MKIREAAGPATAIAALAATVATGACSGRSNRASGPPPLNVDVSRVARRSLVTKFSLDGQVAPLQESTLSTPESGTVTAVYVNEGDRVRAGQLLATLDTAQLQAQLAASKAAVAGSEAKLGSSTEQVPISSQQYSSAVSQAEQNVQQAQNRVRTAQAALKNAQMVYESDSSLVRQGYVARTDLEQARATYVSAEQELRNAEQGLPPAQAALQTARTNMGQTRVNQMSVASDRAALAQAQANVRLLQTQIAQSSIYAPFDGVVTDRMLDPGAFAGPNEPIVRLSQLSTVYINVNVPDEDLPYVAPGKQVTFVAASLPGRTFTGAVADVNATPATGTLSYRARLRQPNPGAVLRGGMLVTVTVQKESRHDTTVVPRAALFQGDDGWNVYTVDGGKAKLLPVHVGIETDTLAEVHGAGIRPGTPVITTRPDALQNGSVVAVDNGAAVFGRQASPK